MRVLSLTVAPPGPHAPFRSVIQQLRARGANLIVVCNEGDAEVEDICAGDHCSLIRVPLTADALQPIINIVPLQLLSYHLTGGGESASHAALTAA